MAEAQSSVKAKSGLEYVPILFRINVYPSHSLILYYFRLNFYFCLFSPVVTLLSFSFFIFMFVVFFYSSPIFDNLINFLKLMISYTRNKKIPYIVFLSGLEHFKNLQ